MNPLFKKAVMAAIVLGPLSIAAQNESAFVEFVVDAIHNGKAVECPLCRTPLVYTDWLGNKNAVPPSTQYDVKQSIIAAASHITIQHWNTDNNETVTVMVRDEEGTTIELPRIVDTSKPLTIKLHKGWLLSVFVSKTSE